MDERLRAIAETVAAAGKALNPVLTEADVAAFESRHGIALPEGFRRFLTGFGDGGDGPPYYGLVPLGRGPNSTNRDEVLYWEQLPDVRLPFPFTRPWCWEGGDRSDEGTVEQAQHGCIFLGEDGCGMDWILVVSGPERGNVWMVGGEGVIPTAPKRDFLTWYEDWMAGVDNWFA